MDSVDTRAGVTSGTALPNRQRLELEPAVVLPEQMVPAHLAGAALVPEKLLLLAVLEEAIATFQRHVTDTGRRGRRLFREAEEWLLSEEREWPCSFRNICDALGLDESYLRGGLLRWRDERLRDPAALLSFRPCFRRLSGSRTRAVGRPIGLGRIAARGDDGASVPAG